MITIDFETKPIAMRPDYPPEPVGVAIRCEGQSEYLAWGHDAGGNNATAQQAQMVLRGIWASDEDVKMDNEAQTAALEEVSRFATKAIVMADDGTYNIIDKASGKVISNHATYRDKPEQARSEKAKRNRTAKKAAAEAGDRPAISKALAERLSETLTLASADVVADTPKIGLALLVAGFRVMWRSPVGVVLKRRDGMNAAAIEDIPGDAQQVDREFGKFFAELVETDEPRLIAARLAAVAAASLNFHSFGSALDDVEGCREIVAALPAAPFRRRLVDRFDAAGYFDAASAVIAKAEIDEIGVEAPAGAKKAAVIKTFAAKTASATGWLPPELRTVHYTGPGSESQKTADSGKQTRRRPEKTVEPGSGPGARTRRRKTPKPASGARSKRTAAKKHGRGS